MAHHSEMGEGGKDNPSFQLRDMEGEQEKYVEIDLGGKKDKPKKVKHLDDSEDMFEDKEHSGNIIGNSIERFWSNLWRFVSDHWSLVKMVLIVKFVILYNIFLIGAIYYGVSSKDSLDYCDDVGFLIIITVIVYLALGYFLVIKRFFGRRIQKSLLQPLSSSWSQLMSHSWAVPAIYALVLLTIAIFVFVDTRDDPSRLVSALGVIVLVLLGFVFSRHPGYVVWRHVVWGLVLQFVFGLLILRWKVGKAVFSCLGNKVATFLGYTDVGSSFVFGYLVDSQPFIPGLLNGTAAEVATELNNSGSVKFVFMFKVLSIIYFFNFMVSMFFYLGSMQWLVAKLGWLLQVTVGTTACESMNAAGNIFLGQSEAPLMIKPYLPDMTKSEIHAVMTGGFATIAGSVLAAYISFGISASHLLSASLMSAPAALAYAKLLYPETKKSKTTAANLSFPKTEESNILDAAATGATQAVFLVGNIAASLVAFLAFVAFVNGLLGWFGGLVSIPFLSLEFLLGWIFYPLAFLMGIKCGSDPGEVVVEGCPPDDCQMVGVLVGLKTIVNEFVGYDRLASCSDTLTTRSQAIATYALCGFANPASIGVQIACLSYMAPSRKGHIAQVALRAFVAGSAACFLTACIAGTLIKETGDAVMT